MLGGGMGSFLRFWLGTTIPFTASEFAWATFLVNMAGCFAIGGCYPFLYDPTTKVFLVIGVLGGFTTFSGMGLEIFRYLENNQFRLAFSYGFASFILGTVLVWLGYKVGVIIA